MKENMESRLIVLLIFSVGARWKLIVSFTPRPLYQWGRIPVPIKQGASWDPKRVWTFWIREKSLANAGIRTSDPPDLSLCYPGSYNFYIHRPKYTYYKFYADIIVLLLEHRKSHRRFINAANIFFKKTTKAWTGLYWIKFGFTGSQGENNFKNSEYFSFMSVSIGRRILNIRDIGLFTCVLYL